MKKTLVKSLAMAFVGSLLMVGSALALPFNSAAYVNPDLLDTHVANSTTGTAQFSFYVQDTGVEVNSLWIELENDIFDSANTSVGNFTVLTPFGSPEGTWTVSAIYNESSTKYALSSGTPTVNISNSPILVNFNYTLLSGDQFSNGSGTNSNGTWAWDESLGNKPWDIAYGMNGIKNGLLSVESGGSASPVPEPATMLLLGTGLVGLAGARRRKATKA